MKIGITCYPTVGGSGVIATELGLQLAARGHKIHFIAYDLPLRLDNFHSNVQFHPVGTNSYPLFNVDPYTLALSVKMAEVSLEHKLDVLHVHYAIPHATCAYLTKQLLLGKGERAPKIVTTLHGTDITLIGVDPAYFELARFSLNNSDGITAVSQYLAKETYNVFHLEKEVRVIYNFIDPSVYKPFKDKALRKTFAKKGEFLLGHLSNFRPVKRTLDVIDIFEQIVEKVPAKLLMVGEGPDTTLAHRAVMRRGLSDKVIFLGKQNMVVPILACLDLLLMPSEDESFGLAALEALACGVPVIGTLKTGLVEVISEGKNGYLLNIGDTRSMATKALSLLKNPSRLESFKATAQRISHKKFNADKIVSEYENYYKEVVHG